MSVQGNEPLEQPEMGQADNEGQQSQGHPAWQEILDVLPDSLHELVTPTLKKWDEGVTNRFTEIREQYNPYKELIENEVDPVLVQQALGLVNQINENPSAVVGQILEAFELKDYVAAAELEALRQAQQQQEPSYKQPSSYYDEPAGDDFFNDPRFKAMTSTLEQLQSKLEMQDNATREQQEIAEWENYLGSLKSAHGEFDEEFVTNLVAQGVDGVEAVKRYHSIVNQAAAKLAQQNGIQPNAQQTSTPIVMGSEGQAGAGVGQQPIKMGTLDRSATNDLVVQMLKQASQDG